jgi:hypothetical protein
LSNFLALNNLCFQIHEHRFDAHPEGEEEAGDSFLLDRYLGSDTELAVYFAEVAESYIKSILLRSRRGSTFTTISDTRASLHYVTMYGVPFDAVRMIRIFLKYRGRPYSK